MLVISTQLSTSIVTDPAVGPVAVDARVPPEPLQDVALQLGLGAREDAATTRKMGRALGFTIIDGDGLRGNAPYSVASTAKLKAPRPPNAASRTIPGQSASV